MDYVIEDIETIHKKFQNIIETTEDTRFEIPENEYENYKNIINYLIDNPTCTKNILEIKKQFGTVARNSNIIKVARLLYQEKTITKNELLFIETKLRVKRCKSHSGVLVVTIFTSPYPEYTDKDGNHIKNSFSCNWNCHYCPNEPNQPRSYLQGEPGVLRANTYKFDCINQMNARLDSLYSIGHPIDKLEILVLGGTWHSYPIEYRREFIRDMYYSANTYFEPSRRSPQNLEYERDANRHAICKIIGLTLETRPDTITVKSIIEARELGCTRIQLGIQHIDDNILNHINRQCSTSRTIKAIELLKDWGFKIDAHFMPNLPSATPEIDHKMFIDELLNTQNPYKVAPMIDGIEEWTVWNLERPDLQVDQWKVYPCEVVPFTEIEKWYKEGTYKPYPESLMEPILLEIKKNMFPWIRLNRIIRDIPTDYIMASADHPNTRQILQDKMKANGWKCRCIRCREVKLATMTTVVYRVAEYNASNGIEYFISAEDQSGDILYGFLRLRVKDTQENAWIRELHVYGLIQKTVENDDTPSSQHKGIGKQLMAFATEIALKNYKTSIWVISGEGTKEYYKKLGYCEGKYGYMCLNIRIVKNPSPMLY
jgi:histone acetyltransferase (RNA polymerase elongator complex component)